MGIIEANNIGVMFTLKHDKRWTIKKSAMSIFKKKPPKQPFWALKKVSFKVNKGEILGIIGKNGSGKTTLLRVIGGIFRPDQGSIDVNGKVSTLLSISAGFQPELSGLENIYINGAILGQKKKQIDAVIDDIVDFSELHNFIDIPIKAYSSGMHARLGFSIAVNIEREIILIDEILGVGDSRFREKCERKMKEFKEQGKTILLVSHNTEAIRSFCNKVILLDKGTIIGVGKPEKVIEQYMKL
jgi:ABC-type polysaccharide/polyol phosphate transport system ATPase subunit